MNVHNVMLFIGRCAIVICALSGPAVVLFGVLKSAGFGFAGQYLTYSAIACSFGLAMLIASAIYISLIGARYKSTEQVVGEVTITEGRLFIGDCPFLQSETDHVLCPNGLYEVCVKSELSFIGKSPVPSHCDIEMVRLRCVNISGVATGSESFSIISQSGSIVVSTVAPEALRHCELSYIQNEKIAFEAICSPEACFAWVSSDQYPGKQLLFAAEENEFRGWKRVSKTSCEIVINFEAE
jgi:hypothetical protein